MNSTTPDLSKDSNSPKQVEQEVVALFTMLADTFHLPKSLGAIYGYLFCHQQPSAFEDIVAGLNLSKASVSSGLKALQQLQAVRPVIVNDDRRSFFEAEIEMRRLLAGFISSELRPQLSVVEEKLDNIQRQIATTPNDDDKIIAERLGKLRKWSKSAKTLLPTLQNFFGL